jgi:uncharacterized cupredoxin-like copper-binding protein
LRSGHDRPARAVAGLLVAAAVGLSACGGDDGGGGGSDAGASLEASGSPVGTEDSPRTVEVAMVDNAFEPTEIEVAEGETVRFAFRNEGAVVHDAVIGDESTQEEHEDEMRAAEDTTTSGTGGDMGGMDHGATSEEREGDGDGDEEAAITVEPGEEGEITYTFGSAGELMIGCHEPGHYEAGMNVAVDVT